MKHTFTWSFNLWHSKSKDRLFRQEIKTFHGKVIYEGETTEMHI